MGVDRNRTLPFQDALVRVHQVQRQFRLANHFVGDCAEPPSNPLRINAGISRASVRCGDRARRNGEVDRRSSFGRPQDPNHEGANDWRTAAGFIRHVGERQKQSDDTLE
jgi:hypothetical protein